MIFWGAWLDDAVLSIKTGSITSVQHVLRNYNAEASEKFHCPKPLIVNGAFLLMRESSKFKRRMSLRVTPTGRPHALKSRFLLSCIVYPVRRDGLDNRLAGFFSLSL